MPGLPTAGERKENEMKILVPTMRPKDIGELDHVVRLPTTARTSIGMKTICDHCGLEIGDEFFIAGFKLRMPNMKFHEACVS